MAEQQHKRGRGSLNKLWRRSAAAVVAAATLMGGVAPAAFAAGGGGNQPGTGGGGLDAAQFWQYRDGPDGSWGPATSLDSVRKAMKAAGVTMLDEGGSYNGPAKAQAALDQARAECERGFNQRHPNEAGQANCRVVAVGAVAGSQAQGTNGWNGSGIVARQTWIDNWKSRRGTGATRSGSGRGRSSGAGEQSGATVVYGAATVVYPHVYGACRAAAHGAAACCARTAGEAQHRQRSRQRRTRLDGTV